MTICLIKFAIGERNFTISYRFLHVVVLYEYIVIRGKVMERVALVFGGT